MISRFNPIVSVEQLLDAVRYVAEQTSVMCEKIVGERFPITSLTIFSHSPDECVLLTKLLLTLGDHYDEHNGLRVQLHVPIEVGSNAIALLRVRHPDVARPQVGCNDFDVDYVTFKEKYLSQHFAHLRLIKRTEYDMIEFADPEFDVLAYVVSD